MTASPGAAKAEQLSAGSHVCWLVDDPAEYVCGAASFLTEGKRLGQRPVLFGPAGSVPLAEVGPLAKLAVDPFTDLLKEGPLDHAVLVEAFREQSALARADGYEGVRLVADMDWLLPAAPTPDVLVTFETALDRVTAELDVTTICAYRRRSFAPAALGGALAVHSTLRGHDAEPQFRFTFDGSGGWRLSGEIDIAVSSLVAAAFSAAVSFGNCTVNVHDLKFIDLSGMRAIVDAAATAAGLVELRGIPSVFKRYWQVCDFGQAHRTLNLAT